MRVPRLEVKMLSAAVILALVVCLSGFAHAAGYQVTMLVSDQTGTAAFTDPHLINPWGISLSPAGPFWVSDNGTGLSTLYNTTGTPQSLVVTIPPGAAGGPLGVPTGTVFNGTTDFVVTKATKSSPAPFLFVGEDGTISGWAPTVDPTNAILAVDNSANSDYKGMELANNGSGNFLYIPNFFAGTVDVFNGSFQKVNLAGSFTDTHLPAGFAPFNIRLINGQLFVAYAKQNGPKHDARPGPGLGLIDIFDLNGNFVKRFATKGKLNAPWGLALAPANFGAFSGNLLVGNLGDGRITAYDITTGKPKGQLATAAGQGIVLKGLWALNFGNGSQGGVANVLYFTSGPGGYKHGRFGSIAAQ